jgi:hypothetical protein
MPFRSYNHRRINDGFIKYLYYPVSKDTDGVFTLTDEEIFL